MPKNQLESIEARIQRLEDIGEIQSLRARLARGADDDHNLEIIMPLFAEDAVIQYTDPEVAARFGEHRGKEAIRRYLKRVPGNIMTWSIHYWLSPIIHLADDGQTATGDWYYWGVYDMPNPETKKLEGIMMGARFWDDYVKINGKWLFHKSKVHIEMATLNHPDGALWNVLKKGNA